MTTIKDRIINTVLDTINEYDLIKNNDRIIIGISGGPDSTALFFILNELKKEYNLKLIFAHLNHMLRGKESDKDEKFVRGLSLEYDIPLKVKKVNIPGIKKKKRRLSIEEISHIQRYEFFQSLLEKSKFDKIALGHNLNDNIENFFLRSLNGGSIRSLAIKPAENNIIRPLIKCFKKELEKFVSQYRVPFRYDMTNKDESYPRNWIRHKLIPYIKKNYKSTDSSISNLINIIFYENKYIEDICEQFIKENVVFNENFYTVLIKADGSLSPGLLRRIIQKIFHKLNIEYNFYIIDLLAGFIVKSNNKSIRIGKDLFVWRFKHSIVLSLKKYMQNYAFSINKVPDKIIIENLNLSVKINEVSRKDFILNANSLFFDKSKLNKIIIRQKKINDYIILMNTGFKSKLKKFFIDLKLPVPLKKMIPVVESNNEVAGIYFNIFPVFIKNRTNDRYKVTEKTKRIIKMEFTKW